MRPRHRRGAQEQRRKLRAVLLCAVGTGNTGNDQSLLTAVRLFDEARPGARFLVATPHVEGARELLRLPVIPIRQSKTTFVGLTSRTSIVRAIICGEIRRFLKMYRLLRTADLTVVTGTGIFDDFGEKPWTMPYALLSWASLSRLVNRPFCFMSVGAGPVQNRLIRWEFAAAARLATSVSYRDRGSQEFMSEIGAGRGDARVAPDIAFATERPSTRPAEPTAEHLVVGVGVMAYGGWSAPTASGPVYDHYVQCIAKVVAQLTRDGHMVELLVGQPCDLQMVNDVIASSGGPSEQLTVPSILDFPALLGAVGRTDVVIATRYHNLVAALMMERPVVSLSYAPKNQDLLASIGVRDFDRSIEEATPEWILQRFAVIRSGRSDFNRRAWDTVAGWPNDIREELGRVLGCVERETAPPASSTARTGGLIGGPADS